MVPRFNDEAERRAYYHDKYGDFDGEKRYRAARTRRKQGPPPAAEADAPIDQPQGSLLDQLQEKQPKRRQAKPTKTQLTLTVANGIALANTLAGMAYPPWREDALNFEEIGRLADALADEILHSEKLTAWVMKATKNSVHVKLGLVVAGIALPRMQRRGMIPAGMMPESPGPNGHGPLPEGALGSQEEGPLPAYTPEADMYARMGEASA